MEAPSRKKAVKKKFDSMNIYSSIADIKNYRKDYKDPLKLLLNLTLEPMKFKIILLVIIYVTCQFSFALCLTIYRVLSTFDEKILLAHGAFGGIEIFVLINLWTVLLKYKEIIWFSDVFSAVCAPVTEHVIGEKKYKDMCSWIFFLKVVVLVNLGLALIAATGFTLSPEYFNTRTYLAVWVKENYPDYAESILFIVHLSNFPVALILSSLAIILAYFGYSAVLQIIFLNQMVEGICESNIPPEERYSSKTYQLLVKQKLKMSIMLHSLAADLCLKAVDIVYIPIIAFSLGGVILGGSLLLEFFTNDSSEISNQYFGIICFALSGGISSALYVSTSQHLKNESEMTLTLLNELPWFYMDKDNLLIYRFFSLRTERPISVNTNLLEINYLLLVRIFKAIYSFAALIAQFVTTTAGTSQ